FIHRMDVESPLLGTKPRRMRTRGWPDGDNLKTSFQFSNRPQRIGICEVCETEAPITLHHIIPREFRKRSPKVPLCWPCHRRIHSLFRNSELALIPWDVVKKNLRSAN